MKRISATLLIAAAVVALTAAPALAHVDLASSNPASGAVITEPLEAITLEFTIPAVIAGDGIVLYGGDAEPLAAEVEQTSDTVVIVTPIEPLTDGRYAVTWNMQSGDAHPVSGVVEFSVSLPAPTTTTTVAETAPETTVVAGTDSSAEAADSTTTTATPTAPVATTPPSAVTAQSDGTSLLDSVLAQPGFPFGQVLTAIGRAAAIAASLIGIGGLTFGVLVLRGSRREAETVGFWMRRAGAVVMLSAPVILLGRVMETGTSGLRSIAFEMLLQAAGGLALFVGTRIVTMPDRSAPPSPSGGTATLVDQRFRVGSSPLALAGIVALVLSFALDGHSGALEPAWLMTAASMSHVVAAAVWVGGVALLGRTLLGRARRGEQLHTGSLVIPFSVVAAVAVTVVGVAGAVMTFVITDGLGTLFTTPWGWAMLSKLGFVAVAGGIGAYNHFVLVPLLKSNGDHPYASQRIMQAVRIEIVCLVLAATITGALVGLSAV